MTIEHGEGHSPASRAESGANPEVARLRAALLNLSRAVQAIERIEDLQDVVRTMYLQLGSIGLDVTGLTFQRAVKDDPGSFDGFGVRPNGTVDRSTVYRPSTHREWLAQRVLYRRDLNLPVHRVGLPDDFKPAYQALGYSIRCILHVPNRHGILTLRSETPNAFSDQEVSTVSSLAEMLDLAISRVQDLEALEARNNELAAANESLRESEERLRHTLDNLDLVAYEFDAQGRWVLSRGRGLERLGVGPDQFRGASIHDTYADYPAVVAAARKALTGRSQRFELEQAGRHWSVSFNPVLDAAGRVGRVYGTAVDVTDQKQAESAALETERLRALMETAGAAAHEINQPLTAIIGHIQLLLGDFGAVPPPREDLKLMLECAERISDIVRKMREARRYATLPYMGKDRIVDFGESSKRTPG